MEITASNNSYFLFDDFFMGGFLFHDDFRTMIVMRQTDGNACRIGVCDTCINPPSSADVSFNLKIVSLGCYVEEGACVYRHTNNYNKCRVKNGKAVNGLIMMNCLFGGRGDFPFCGNRRIHFCESWTRAVLKGARRLLGRRGGRRSVARALRLRESSFGLEGRKSLKALGINGLSLIQREGDE